MTNEHNEQANGAMPATRDNTYRAPGLNEIAVEHSPPRHDVMRDMITGSGEVEQFLPRAVLDKQDLKATIRFLSDDAFMETGDPQMAQFLWMNIVGSVAVDGRGREDVVSMYTGQPTSTLGRLVQGTKSMFGGGGRRRRQGGNAQDFKGG